MEDGQDTDAIIQDARREKDAQKPKVNMAVFVFLGSLFGTLLGLTGDLGDAMDTIARFRALTYPRLCVVGSTTILGEELDLAANWERDFETQQPVRLEISAIGSEAGVQRAADGDCAHVLAMSEPLPEESRQMLDDADVEITCAAEIAYDPVIFVTDFNNAVPPLSLDQVRAILNGEVTDWSQVGGRNNAIHIFYNPQGGTTHYVLSKVGGIPSVNQLPRNASYVPCHSTAECLEKSLSTAGSLFASSAAWLHDQPAYFRVNAIRNSEGIAVDPYTDLADLKDYPAVLIRPLYLYAVAHPNTNARLRALAQEFVEYTRSARAQQWVEKDQFFSYFWRPYGVEVPLPPGFEPPGEGARQVCRPVP